MYKSKLQELCQKQKLGMPKYTCIRDGADHCPQFKASVVVAGAAFHSPSAANSSKQAYNQVAQLAFSHFTSQKNVGKKEVESSKSSVDHNLHQAFKNKLRMYAQRKDLKQPEYKTEKEGDCFKATVSIAEESFTSNELCASAEEAQNSAAATALLALLTDAFHENYKALLHKVGTEEGFIPPVYKTISHGCDSFSSTVEVEGEVFEGAAAQSQKLAELSAAKAAYTALIERKLFEPRDEALEVARRFESCDISYPQQKHESIGESEMKSSYLLCNRVRVFTCMPNVALPEGTLVLPISEDRWAMVALEFPNR
ncbi:double-stranded RNA-binding protein 1-like isoform X1 [Salvia miltiorrhiza]|uniref:double-stranded RNA-binding protein 1-like isoform X1 n=1 Tax=Salvia miltiorrhiza TaxID=226208 RepID=UPI0025ABA842|nr:double-stranded RNA-binding protein 1-like isoform X1 [Salvia miltiorrhiza]